VRAVKIDEDELIECWTLVGEVLGQVAGKMGVTTARVSQIEHGRVDRAAIRGCLGRHCRRAGEPHRESGGCSGVADATTAGRSGIAGSSSSCPAPVLLVYCAG